LIAVVIMMIHPLRRKTLMLNIACVLTFIGIWIEKGMGLVIPGFVPTPLGEIFEYVPTSVELSVAAAIWALGILIFTLLAKAVIAIEQGKLRYHAKEVKYSS